MEGRVFFLRFRWLIDKSRSNLGRGNHALICFSEQSITIRRDQVINMISNWLGKRCAEICQPFEWRQAAKDVQKCRGAAIFAPAVEENDRFQSLRIPRLQCREMEDALRVVADDPLHRAV